jgi:DNA helicase-2/ATP-dependent DNA helicase PcrA
LYRTNSQSRVIEEALRRRNIPYKIFAGHSFYERKEIKDVLAYMRLVINHNDNDAFRRVINFPARGIGATSMECLVRASIEKGVSLWDAISLNDLPLYGLKGAALTKMVAFRDLIQKFSA